MIRQMIIKYTQSLCKSFQLIELLFAINTMQIVFHWRQYLCISYFIYSSICNTIIHTSMGGIVNIFYVPLKINNDLFCNLVDLSSPNNLSYGWMVAWHLWRRKIHTCTIHWIYCCYLLCNLSLFFFRRHNVH